MKPSRRKKGTVTATRANPRLVNLLVPVALLAPADQTTDGRDTDRAKWVREAIREKLRRECPEHAGAVEVAQ